MNNTAQHHGGETTGAAGRRIRVAVDVGGTFTDIQIYDVDTGATMPHKTPTTSEDPSIGLVEGLKQAGERYAFDVRAIESIVHGTTIATNAVLEGRFARGALVTTEGFEDVLEIGRHSRLDIYSTKPQPTPALIPRSLRIGVLERMSGSGLVEKEMSSRVLDDLVGRIADLGVETVAVSLLNAYLNPVHEKQIAERLARDLPDVLVSLSSRVSPEIREYERTSTTVLNALLVPIVKRYLDRLEQRLAEAGITARLFIVQSNGGVCKAATAAAEPVRLLLSGPSGGTLGALAIARSLGLSSLIAADMGGTSYDVSIVRDQQVELVNQGSIAGHPVRLPMVEIRTIGSGGGSIAHVGATGQVSVGPRSAGAWPGPVCYRHGGTEPTVTDANLVMHHLDPEGLLGGSMTLDLPSARKAIETKFAQPLNLDVEPAAAGIINITNASLASAIKLSLFEKGLDPRDFSLLSFGGAGSMHACAVAQELGIHHVIFPKNASTFSAWGILFSDVTHDFAQSRVMDTAQPDTESVLRQMLEALCFEGNAQLDEDGISPANRRLHWLLDLRYRGQAFELTVPGGELDLQHIKLDDMIQRFHEMHQQRFSYANQEDPVELVVVRLVAVGKLDTITTTTPEQAHAGGNEKSRPVWMKNGWRDVPVLRREWITPEKQVRGPLIIEEEYTTLLVGEHWYASCDATGQLHAYHEDDNHES